MQKRKNWPSMNFDYGTFSTNAEQVTASVPSERRLTSYSLYLQLADLPCVAEAYDSLHYPVTFTWPKNYVQPPVSYVDV